MQKDRIRSCCPAIGGNIIDISGVRKRVAADEIRILTNSARGRPKYDFRHVRHRRPCVAYNVVAVMQVRIGAVVPALDVDELAGNAAPTACQWARHVCPCCVPSICNRVVFPSLTGWVDASVKATDNVNFAVGIVVGRARGAPGIRHRSALRPSVRGDVVDLRGVENVHRGEAAEDINLVDVRSVSCPRIAAGSWKARQRRPTVRSGIISVKGVRLLWVRVPAAACGIRICAVTGHGGFFDRHRVKGDKAPRAGCAWRAGGRCGWRRGW